MHFRLHRYSENATTPLLKQIILFYQAIHKYLVALPNTNIEAIKKSKVETTTLLLAIEGMQAEHELDNETLESMSELRNLL